MAISDRVGVMRQGKLVGVAETKDVNERILAAMMVGKEVLLDALDREDRGKTETARGGPGSAQPWITAACPPCAG